MDLVTSTQASPDLTPMRDALLALSLNGKIVGILHTENDSLADVCLLYTSVNELLSLSQRFEVAKML